MDFLKLDKAVPIRFGSLESVCQMLNALFDCDYVIAYFFSQHIKDRREIIVRSFTESEIYLAPEAISDYMAAMMDCQAHFLQSTKVENIGFGSNYTVMVSSLGYNQYFRGTLALVSEKSNRWDEGDLEKFDMMNKLTHEAYGLQENKLYSETIIDSLDTAVFAVSVEGTMLKFNKAAERIFGCDAEWAIGKHYVDTMASKERGKMRSSFDYVMRTGHTYRGDMVEMTCLNNKVVYLNSIIVPWINTNGDIIGAIGIMKDETENKRFQDQLIRAEKMAILGQIAAQVSHELMSPLASIRGFARIIQKNESPESKYYNYSKIIVEQVDRVSSIVREMLDFSRPDEIKQDIIDVNEAIIGAVSQVEIDRERVAMVEIYGPDVPPISGDFQKIERMFVNLLQNAYQSIKEAGLIEIKTWFSADDNDVVITIKDSGCGIPREYIDKVFDPYYTTKAEGTGLGLAIVMQTVQSHGGKIRIFSEVSLGTCFTLIFPVRRDMDDE